MEELFEILNGEIMDALFLFTFISELAIYLFFPPVGFRWDVLHTMLNQGH